MIEALLSLAYPGAGRARFSILIFHRVLPGPDALNPHEWTRETFDLALRHLKSSCHVFTLAEACRRLKEETLPPRSVSITFDDGYADNYTEALPLLRRYGLRGTFFVTSGVLDGGRMWNDTVIEAFRRSGARDSSVLRELVPSGEVERLAEDPSGLLRKILARSKYLAPGERRRLVERLQTEIEGLPTNLMMTREQVAALHAEGMEVGGHTHSHPILARLPDKDARTEIRKGKESLEEIVGTRLVSFAYPNGRFGDDFDRRHVDMVREAGFEHAATTDWGVVRRGTPSLALPRFTPWKADRIGFFLGMVRNRYGIL